MATLKENAEIIRTTRFFGALHELTTQLEDTDALEAQGREAHDAIVRLRDERFKVDLEVKAAQAKLVQLGKEGKAYKALALSEAAEIKAQAEDEAEATRRLAAHIMEKNKNAKADFEAQVASRDAHLKHLDSVIKTAEGELADLNAKIIRARATIKELLGE